MSDKVECWVWTDPDNGLSDWQLTRIADDPEVVEIHEGRRVDLTADDWRAYRATIDAYDDWQGRLYRAK